MPTVAIADNTKPWRVLLAATVVPLFLAVAGWLSLTYLAVTNAELEESRRVTEEELRRFEELREQGVENVTGRDGRGRPVDIPVADVLQGLRQFDRDSGSRAHYHAARRVVARAVIVLGLAAALVGAAAVVGTLLLKAASLRSRDVFARTFIPGHRALLLVMLWQTLCLGGGFLALAFFFGYGQFAAPEGPDGTAGDFRFLFVIAAIVAIFTCIGLFTCLRDILLSYRAATEDMVTVLLAEAVPRDAARKLWDTAADAARRVGSGPPDHIVVGLTGGFSVTRGDVILYGTGEMLCGKTLYIPVTMLPFLSLGEFTAIVAHEFGHFAGGDLSFKEKFSLPFQRILQSILASAAKGQPYQTLRETVFRPVLSPAILFFNAFQYVYFHWARESEFAADKVSERAAGGRSRATALIRTELVTPVIAAVLEDVWHNADKDRGSILGLMAETARRDGFGNPQECLDSSQPHPYDTHPPSRERIEAMGYSCDDAELLAEAARPVGESLAPGYLPQADAIGERLAGVYRRDAAEAMAEYDAKVADMAALAKAEPFVLYGRRLMSDWAGCSLLAMVAALGFGILTLVWSASSSPTLTVAAFVCAALLAIPPIWSWRRNDWGDYPVLSFMETGIVSEAFGGEVLWTAVEDFTIVPRDNSHLCTLNITLKAPPPPLKRYESTKFVVARWDDDAHLLSLILPRLRDRNGDITPETMAEECRARINAGIGRALQEERRKMRE